MADNTDLNALLNTRVKLTGLGTWAPRADFPPLLDHQGYAQARLSDVVPGMSRGKEDGSGKNLTLTLKWSLLDEDVAGEELWDVPKPVTGMTQPRKAGVKPRQNIEGLYEELSKMGMTAEQRQSLNDADVSIAELIEIIKEFGKTPKYIEYGPDEFNGFWSTRRSGFITKERYEIAKKLETCRKLIDPAIKAKNGGTTEASTVQVSFTSPGVAAPVVTTGATPLAPPPVGNLSNLAAILGRR